MIVKTRYRDIPFEEAIKCAVMRPGIIREARKNWRERKGKPVAIIAPADPNQWEYVRCEGPFFWTTDDFLVCPHIAEIGD